MPYAENTGVSSDRSRAELERTLARFGAISFTYGYNATTAVVEFQTADRQVRFVLPMPDRTDRKFTHTAGRNQKRTPTAAAEQYEQAVRQRWRALNLVVKAKLEAVETGIVNFDSEFLAHIVLPGGRTVGDTAAPAVERAYETNEMVSLIPDYTKAIEA